MKEATTMTVKGQVTIPKEIRDAMGLKPGDRITFEQEGDKILLKPAKSVFNFRGYVKAERHIPIEEARNIAKERLVGRTKKGI